MGPVLFPDPLGGSKKYIHFSIPIQNWVFYFLDFYGVWVAGVAKTMKIGIQGTLEPCLQ